MRPRGHNACTNTSNETCLFIYFFVIESWDVPSFCQLDNENAFCPNSFSSFHMTVKYIRTHLNT